MKWLENLKTRLADQKPTNLIVRIEDMGWPEFIKDQQRRDLAQRATCHRVTPTSRSPYNQTQISP